jgi:hypothetical protein
MIYNVWKDSVNWFRKVVLTLLRAELQPEHYRLLPERVKGASNFVLRRTQNGRSTS